MIFKTCKSINFLNKCHSAILIKSGFEVLSTARFANAVNPKQSENTTANNVSNKTDVKSVECKVTELVGKESFKSIKGLFRLRKPNHVGCCFVWDNTYAKKIVEKVLGNDKFDSFVVLDGNPGFGLTTVNFLEAGIPKLYVFPGSFVGTTFYDKYSDKFESCHQPLFSNRTFDNQIILNILEKSSKSGKINKIVGVTAAHNFLSSLPHQLLDYNVWDIFDSTEFYPILSKQAYTRIANHRLSASTFLTYCLFSCLFDVELLDEYPTSAFLPVLDTSAMYLLKVKKKPAKSLQISEHLLPEYVTFIKVLGAQKTNLIIQTLEQWVPGCGLHLISKGIRLTTEVKDISANESIILFNLITKCEGYENFKVMHKLLEKEEKELKGK